MLCDRVTRNVAKNPQRMCWETAAEPCMVNPMTTATMKQMMDRREAVNKPKTISFDSTKLAALEKSPIVAAVYDRRFMVTRNQHVFREVRKTGGHRPPLQGIRWKSLFVRARILILRR